MDSKSQLDDVYPEGKCDDRNCEQGVVGTIITVTKQHVLKLQNF